MKTKTNEREKQSIDKSRKQFFKKQKRILVKFNQEEKRDTDTAAPIVRDKKEHILFMGNIWAIFTDNIF